MNLSSRIFLIGFSGVLTVFHPLQNAFSAPNAPNRVLERRTMRITATQNSKPARSTRRIVTRRVSVRRTTPIRVAQGDAQLAAFERDMAQMVNAERQKTGAPPLAYDPFLAEVARAHSLEMRNRNYFAHESPTAGLRHPQDRYRVAFGRIPAMIAENVYREWGTPRRVTPAQLERGHTSLMNSPGHRANILDSRVRRMGIGIVTNEKGDIWITQMFSRLKW